MTDLCPNRDDIYAMEDKIDSQTLLKSLGKREFPCLYKQIRTHCINVAVIVEDALDREMVDLPESVPGLVEDVRSLIEFCTAIRTSPDPLFCKQHQGILSTEVKWPPTLIDKLANYLMLKFGNQEKTEIHKLLTRFFEIIINPPQDFGVSEAGHEFARQIKTDQIIESPQLCRFLSSIFMFLPGPARKRFCGDLSENLVLMLDPEIITKEMLILFYFVSLNGKFNGGDVINKLLDFIVDSFQFENEHFQDNENENRAIAIQILVNISQNLSESSMTDLMNKLYTRALTCSQRYRRTEILTQVISPLLNSVPVSSFVPICLYFDQDLSGKNEFGITAPENHFLGTQLDVLNESQQQSFLNYIQICSQGITPPLPAFSFEWRKWDLMSLSSSYSEFRGSDSILIVFSVFSQDFWIRLVLYIGSKILNEVTNTAILHDPQPVFESSQGNLLFFCVNDEPLKLLNIQPKVIFGSHSDPSVIEVKDQIKDVKFIEFNSKCLSIHHYNLIVDDQQYSPGLYSLPIQKIAQVYNSTFIWTGAYSLNLNKLQEPYGIYGQQSQQARVFHEVFETLRENQKVFFVPKNMTICEFLTVVFQNEKNMVKNFQVRHQQKTLAMDTKIGDLNENHENSALFEVKDLFVDCKKDRSIMKGRLANPQAAYQAIIQSYSQAIDRPLLEYFSRYGDALGFLNKFSAGEIANKDPFGLFKLYEKVNKAIGPYMGTLRSIFGTNLLLILWHVISKGSATDGQVALQLIYRTILINMKYANPLASDPKQLCNLTIEAMEYLFLNDFMFQHCFPTFMGDLNLTIKDITKAGLIQDTEIFELLVEAVGIRFHSFISIRDIISQELLKNSIFISGVIDQFKLGSQSLRDKCADKKFYRKFGDLAKTIQDGEKISSFVLALSKNEDFEQILNNMISDFQMQLRRFSTIKITQAMEENILILIKYTFGAIDKAIQYKGDVSAETSLMEVTKGTLDIFHFLFDELKTINSQGERASVVMTAIKDITKSVTQILKKPAQPQRMCAQGLDAAKHFCDDCLVEIKKLNLVQTLTNLFEALANFKDEVYSLQVQACVLELLEVWSNHSILKGLFEGKVKCSRVSQEIRFDEFCMGNWKKLKNDRHRPRNMNDGDIKVKDGAKEEMVTVVVDLLEHIRCNLDFE